MDARCVIMKKIKAKGELTMGPNPVEIFGSYMTWKINEDTYVLNFMGGSQNMYLLLGEEKALLIDTGWGAGNLRGLVEKLTDKPVEVILTHGHLDHSGGNGEWEKVMIHSKLAMLFHQKNT